MKLIASAILYGWLLFSSSAFADQKDPLPSWHNRESKRQVIRFVREVTNKHNPHYVPVAKRIAVFDNDGTLWSEKPLYFQFQFVFDQIRALAPKHPEWKQKQPFQAILENDMEALKKTGSKGLLELFLASGQQATACSYTKAVNHWFETAKHPRFCKPYQNLIFKPMRELLSYFRKNSFKNYLVTGGGAPFIRTQANKLYGIPPERVIGTFVKHELEWRDGKPFLVRQRKLASFNDGAEKVVNIFRTIGRRPIAAFGNSDGDLKMLQWTVAGKGRSFAMIIHHTDALREWAYDRQSHVGQLDEARRLNWMVVDMKKDWKHIYPEKTSTNACKTP